MRRNLVMAAIVSLTPEPYDPVVSRNGLLSILRRVYPCRNIYKPIGVDGQSFFFFFSFYRDYCINLAVTKLQAKKSIRVVTKICPRTYSKRFVYFRIAYAIGMFEWCNPSSTSSRIFNIPRNETRLHVAIPFEHRCFPVSRDALEVPMNDTRQIIILSVRWHVNLFESQDSRFSTFETFQNISSHSIYIRWNKF